MRQHLCTSCGGRGEFDAQIALSRMARKIEQMAGIQQRFMSGVVETSGPQRAETVLKDRKDLLITLGQELNRIVGGEPTIAFPECCLVGHRNPNGTISWFCTGVLIHPQIVLTAGHCYLPEKRANIVALGASDQNDLSQAELISIRRIVVHPRYLQTHQVSDMSILILRAAAQTHPVAMATPQETGIAQRVTLVGFGNQDINSTKGFGIKRKVEVGIVSLRRSPADALDSDERSFGYESDLEFVAGGAGFDTCNGDSGGPVYLNINGEQKLVGLTSRSTENSTHPCGDGGIYTRVDAHLEFIRQVAQDAGLVVP